MGCKWCSSGTGVACDGPLSCDDLEAGCDCDCHRCPECGSAYCVSMGGDEECGRDFDPVTGERIADDDVYDLVADDVVKDRIKVAHVPAHRFDAQVRRLDDFGG